MNRLQTILVLAVAFLLVFAEATFDGVRHWLGAQPDVLPGLMIYAGLTEGWLGICLTAVCGGLWYDSFSLDPLGVSVLPLLCIGLLAARGREVLRSDHYAPQFFLGAAAGAFHFAATLFLMLNLGQPPILGFHLLWKWVVDALACGFFTPFCFGLFRRINQAFVHPPARQMTFRADRQIKRGRF